MDREHSYGDLDLTALADLCVNVARSVSTDFKQSDTAHKLQVEWIRLSLDGAAKAEAKDSLKKRMVEFLSGVPRWMASGV